MITKIQFGIVKDFNIKKVQHIFYWFAENISIKGRKRIFNYILKIVLKQILDTEIELNIKKINFRPLKPIKNCFNVYHWEMKRSLSAILNGFQNELGIRRKSREGNRCN